jgi:hypothetical protein
MAPAGIAGSHSRGQWGRNQTTSPRTLRSEYEKTHTLAEKIEVAGGKARGLVPPAGAMVPQRRQALTKCLGLLGEQPPRKAPRACDVGGLPLQDQGGELRAPAGEGLMGRGQSLQDNEVLMGTETVA